MKKIGIAIDPWKLDIFERNLKEGGFTEYMVTPGETMTAITIRAPRSDMVSLGEIVKAANDECARTKMN